MKIAVHVRCCQSTTVTGTECNATACANLFIPPYNMIMTDNNVVLIVLGPNK